MRNRGVENFDEVSSDKIIEDGLTVLNILFDEDEYKDKLSLMLYYLLDKAESSDNGDMLKDLEILKTKIVDIETNKLDISEFKDFIIEFNNKLDNLNRDNENIKDDIGEIKEDIRENSKLLRSFFNDLTFIRTKYVYLSGGVLLVGLVIGSFFDDGTGLINMLLSLL